MSSAPGRRQSTRQVVKTSRPHNYYARNFNGRSAGDAQAASQDAQPGFFPAITHFTDSVDALPKEMIRHFSMLKEVEAKLHAPDEQVVRLVDAVARLPPPPRDQPPPHLYFQNLSAQNSVDGSRPGSVIGTQLSDVTTDTNEMEVRQRQSLFYHMNVSIAMTAPALEEKIAVLSTANQTLQRQLDRMMSSYLHINEEISDEARLGNPKHWAYITDKDPKKAPERSRREVANANTLAAAAAAVAADDQFASRSEARREAVAARKSKNHQVDSDFDDRPAAKKAPPKAKKTTEHAKSVGLGIANGEPGLGKKKRAMAGVPLERSLSGALNNARANQASPRETPDIVPKKRAKPGAAAAAAAAAAKKRIPGAASPQITSSPVLGTFATKDPPLRPGQIRGRQTSAINSIHSAVPEKTARPPSAQSSKTLNGNSALSAYEQPQVSAAAAEQDALKLAPEQAKALKSEEADNAEDEAMPDADVPTPAVVTTRAGRQSKTATPMSEVFPTINPRNRISRTKESASGSHASSESGEVTRSRRTNAGKKNGSAATSTRADDESLHAGDEDVPSLEDDVLPADDEGDVGGEEGEELEDRGDELRYCYCNDVSYGEMVGCDGEGCEREWFHLKCAGLSRPPAEDVKWYCDDCKASMGSKKSRPASRRE